MVWLSTTAIPFVLGVCAPWLLQRFVGWWLDSGRGVALMIAVLCAIAIAFASLRPSDPWRSAWSVGAGGFAGSASLLSWNGPGTIWPIVLVVAAALSVAAALVGAGAVHWAWRAQRGKSSGTV